jgi:hypothetical protein
MSILILSCTENEVIARYADLAEKQQEKSMKQFENKELGQPDFVLHPWKNQCNKEDIVFIAIDGDTILGWMHVYIRVFESRLRNQKTLKIAHVNYISTNQNRAGSGIGKNMMIEMERYMRSKECHFIELFPLESARGFYDKLDPKGLLEPGPYGLEFKTVGYYVKWMVDPQLYRRELKLYESQLNKEQKEMSAKMEDDEEEAFQPIYEKLSRKEQKEYHKQQEEDDSTRIALIITYEEAGIEEVKRMLN